MKSVLLGIYYCFSQICQEKNIKFMLNHYFFRSVEVSNKKSR